MQNYLKSKLFLWLTLMVVLFSTFLLPLLSGGLRAQNYEWQGSSQESRAIHFVSATQGWVVGTGGTIFTTNNGGTTWIVQNSRTKQALNDVFFISATQGWAVGNSGTIITTIDGGITWTAQTSGTTSTLNSVTFISATQGWVVGASGNIRTTTNGGVTWTAQTSGITSTLNSVTFISATQGWAVGPTGTILTTNDGGTTWTAQTSGTTNSLSSVYFISATQGWAVGSLGTILTTTNGGATWTAQTSGTANAIIDINFTSSTQGSAVGLSGTILTTNDGGITWTPQYSGNTNSLLNVSFISATQGWIVGSGGTILTTNNGGGTWTAQKPVVLTASEMRSVYFISPTQGWAVGNSGTILTTSNGGASWTIQNSRIANSLHGVYFISPTQGWVVGNNGTILTTSNGGTTWTAQTSGTTQLLNSVTFISATQGWAVGNTGTILTTNNGGTTWTAQTSGTTTSTFNGVTFISATQGWVVGSSGNIRTTTNGGVTWAAQTSGTTNTTFNSVTFKSATQGWVVGADGAIRTTTNGGTTWTTQTSGTTQTLNKVSFTSATQGWAVGVNGTIRTTTDGGTTWVAQTSNNTETLRDIFFTSATQGWAVGGSGTILTTADGGTTWTTQILGSSQSLTDVIFTSATQGWAVGFVGTILTTNDGGTNWIKQNSGTTVSFTGVTFPSATQGWVVGVNGSIRTTNDGGSTWTNQNSGTANNFNAVIFTSATHGWVVGTTGIIRNTTNGGTTWTGQTSGTTNWLNGVTFISATQGWIVGNSGTILTTNDGGTTWTAQTSGTTEALNSVTFISATQGWAVGSTGTILTTNDGGITWTTQTSGTTQLLRRVYFTSATQGWAVGVNGTILATNDGGITWTQGQYTGDGWQSIFIKDGSGYIVGGILGRLKFNLPTITLSATALTAFTTCAGTASAEQQYTVTGANLTANISIVPPTGFEISTGTGGAFVATNPIILTQTGGNVATTTIYVRQIATAINGASGNITHTSTGAAQNKAIPISVVNSVSITGVSAASVAPTATTFNLAYTGTTGTANQYSIVSAGTATPLTGFVAVNNATLTTSPISVTIPASAANTYNFNLTVRNSITGCVSAIVPFTLQVAVPSPPPPPPARQTITFDSIPDQVFSTNLFELKATASSNLPVSFRLVSGNARLLGTNFLQFTGLGEIVIEANQGGDNRTFAAASPVTRRFRVTSRPQSLSGFAAITDRPWNSESFVVNATSNISGLPVTFTVTEGATIAEIINGNMVRLKAAVGRVTITASQSGDAVTTAATSLTQSFNVTKADQSITSIAGLPTLTFGSNVTQRLAATASSGLPVSFAVVSGNASIAGDQITFTSAGNVVVNYTQAGNDLWNAATLQTRTFSVGKANQEILVTTIPVSIEVGSSATFSASVASGLPVTMRVASGEGTVNGLRLSPTGGASITVEFNQAGNDNYNAAPAVLRTITLTPTLSLGTITGSRFCGGSIVRIDYTVAGLFSGSNIFAVYLSDANGNFTNNRLLVGTANGQTSGTIVGNIPASVPAGTGYRLRIEGLSPAVISASSSQTIEINPLPVQASIVQNGAELIASVATGLQWFANGTAISGATNQRYTPTEAQAADANLRYTVVVTGTGGCTSVSNPVLYQRIPVVTGVDDANLSAKLSVYPNPSSDKFMVELGMDKAGKVSLRMVDALGKEVYQQTITTTTTNLKHEINLTDIASGVYVLMVNVDGKVAVRRVVKQ